MILDLCKLSRDDVARIFSANLGEEELYLTNFSIFPEAPRFFEITQWIIEHISENFKTLSFDEKVLTCFLYSGQFISFAKLPSHVTGLGFYLLPDLDMSSVLSTIPPQVSSLTLFDALGSRPNQHYTSNIASLKSLFNHQLRELNFSNLFCSNYESDFVSSVIENLRLQSFTNLRKFELTSLGHLGEHAGELLGQLPAIMIKGELDLSSNDLSNLDLESLKGLFKRIPPQSQLKVTHNDWHTLEPRTLLNALSELPQLSSLKLFVRQAELRHWRDEEVAALHRLCLEKCDLVDAIIMKEFEARRQNQRLPTAESVANSMPFTSSAPNAGKNNSGSSLDEQTASSSLEV